MKTFYAKRTADDYTAEYTVQAVDKKEAEQKIMTICGEKIKVTEK